MYGNHKGQKLILYIQREIQLKKCHNSQVNGKIKYYYEHGKITNINMEPRFLDMKNNI